MQGRGPGGAANPSSVRAPSLAGQRWTVLEGRRPLLLVPTGSIEQHGPHLPLGTDSMIATAACSAVAGEMVAAGEDVLVAPALSYGASGEHEGFPGTISIGHEALSHLMIEFGRSACRWAGGVVFVNGHGGNIAALKDAVRQLRYEGRAVAWSTCAVPGADAHAGRTETSLLRYLAPWSGRFDLREAGVVDPLPDLMPRLRAEGVRAISPNGVLGDPTDSSAEEGQSIWRGVVDRLRQELAEIDVDDDGRLRLPTAAATGPGFKP